MKEPVIISEDASFADAVKTMAENSANFLLVVDSHGKLMGEIDVVTLMRRAIPEYLEDEKATAHFTTDALFSNCIEDVKDVLVKDFMLKFAKVITPKTSMMEAAIIVTEGRQTKIPVLDENLKPIGVFTRSSLKKVIAAELGYM